MIVELMQDYMKYKNTLVKYTKVVFDIVVLGWGDVIFSLISNCASLCAETALQPQLEVPSKPAVYHFQVPVLLHFPNSVSCRRSHTPWVFAVSQSSNYCQWKFESKDVNIVPCIMEAGTERHFLVLYFLSPLMPEWMVWSSILPCDRTH